MPSDETTQSSAQSTPDGSTGPSSPQSDGPVRRTRRRAASRPAGPPQASSPQPEGARPPSVAVTTVPVSAPESPTSEAAAPVAKKSSSRRGSKKAASAPAAAGAETPAPEIADTGAPEVAEPPAAPAKRTSTRKRAAKPAPESLFDAPSGPSAASETASPSERQAAAVFSPVFQAPVVTTPSPRANGREEPREESGPSHSDGETSDSGAGDQPSDSVGEDGGDAGGGSSATTRRRRSRGGRNRRKSSDSTGPDTSDSDSSALEDGDSPSSIEAVIDQPEATAATAKKTSKKSSTKQSSTKQSSAKQTPAADSGSDQSAEQGSEPKDSDEGGTSSSSRRRRRRRRSGDGASDSAADSPETVVKVREPRSASDSITSVEGSTRIEAKKQRRREGREAGRRRAPILSESEFLARRESVDRVMVIRQRDDVTQIAVLEDSVLVEHYVALETQSSLIGNVYLGRVQNVLPSMEAAFIDIGKGRNAVLYAGEVNWDLIGDRNQPRRIENALRSGQQILVQVSKDPVGHKGARLTSQISLPGRYLVYVPGGGSSGISRKLPDTERNRLKNLLKEILPDESGVIIRTAAEGASEEELTRDVRRLTSRWDEIEKLVKGGKAPTLLYAEPDITLKVVRDLFTEDFAKLVVSGDQAWETVNDYVSYVAPDLTQRLERYDGKGDVFDKYRVDEQIAKALERKVWLPSGGSLVIDRTEAMTVVDVNTGKFTGSGGNLEQTVTKNNLEAAEEIVRQLRLRDIGGIIVVDFIDMVLENNRDLVLRRLVECLGRDRTRHQVAEVTSLGLVQMTRKRIGTGLVESFSVPCEHCHGRGVIIEAEPIKTGSEESAAPGRTSSKRSGGRQRSAAKTEPEPEQVDSHAAERHSAAAAATAAIAAALHPEARAEADQSETASSTDETPTPSGEHHAEDAVPEPDDAPPVKAPRTRKTAAKKATATKTAGTTKKAAAKKTAAKKTAAKKATATKKVSRATTAVASEPVLESVGSTT